MPSSPPSWTPSRRASRPGWFELRYSLRGLGRPVDSGLARVVSEFWGRWQVALDEGPPLPGLSFPSREALSQWAYRLYLDHWQQGTLPNMLVVIPGESLGSWKYTWEGTAYKGYQLALMREQVGPAMRFVATHETGHLLGLSDHYWPVNCIMSWYPWWMIPLAVRRVCPKCRERLESEGGR